MFNEMTGKAPNRPVAGALNIIAASIMFAFMGALIKKASGSLNSGMVVFFRNSVALVLMLPALSRGRSVGGLKTGELGLHMVRSLSGLAAMYFYFYTLTKLPPCRGCASFIYEPFIYSFCGLYLAERKGE